MSKKEKKKIKKEKCNHKWREGEGTDKLQLEWCAECKKLLRIEGEGVEEYLKNKIRQTLQRFIEETKLKKRIYEKEIEEFGIDNSTIEGEFFEQFLDGYNQALKGIKQKQLKWMKENL